MVKGLKNALFMHFSSLPSEHLLSICYFPFSLSLFVTHLFGNKNHAIFFVGGSKSVSVVIVEVRPLCGVPNIGREK